MTEPVDRRRLPADLSAQSLLGVLGPLLAAPPVSAGQKDGLGLASAEIVDAATGVGIAALIEHESSAIGAPVLVHAPRRGRQHAMLRALLSELLSPVDWRVSRHPSADGASDVLLPVTRFQDREETATLAAPEGALVAAAERVALDERLAVGLRMILPELVDLGMGYCAGPETLPSVAVVRGQSPADRLQIAMFCPGAEQAGEADIARGRVPSDPFRIDSFDSLVTITERYGLPLRIDAGAGKRRGTWADGAWFTAEILRLSGTLVAIRLGEPIAS